MLKLVHVNKALLKPCPETTLNNNLNAFISAGFVSQKQKEIIQEILEAGHATMHRAYKPERFDVVKLIDITENVIEIIYVNEKEIKELASKVPRKKIKKKG